MRSFIKPVVAKHSYWWNGTAARRRINKRRGDLNGRGHLADAVCGRSPTAILGRLISIAECFLTRTGRKKKKNQSSLSQESIPGAENSLSAATFSLRGNFLTMNFWSDSSEGQRS